MPRLSLPILAILLCSAAFMASAQEAVTPVYTFQPSGTLKYKKVEHTDAYTQVQNGLDADINRQTETYFGVNGVASPDGNPTFELVQDTVFVEEKSRTRVDQEAALAFVNIVTKKRLQFRITPQGGLITAVALDRLARPQNVPSSVPDSYFAQQSMFLPPLPTREVRPGDTWTETRSDTLNNSRTTADVDRSDNITFITSTTEWTIGDWESLSSRRCLKISSRNVLLTETKRIQGRNETYIEDRTVTTATVYLDVAGGVLVKSETKTNTESTLATYNLESTVRPSTIKTEKTIILLPS